MSQQTEIESIAELEDIRLVAGIDIDEVDFETAGASEWPSFVPDWAPVLWKQLTRRERALIAVIAEEEAEEVRADGR